MERRCLIALLPLAFVLISVLSSATRAQEQIDPDQRYLLLATQRTATMQEELDGAAAQGFRLLPRTMSSKSRRFSGEEIVVVLERAPKAGQLYEYKVLATTRTATLQAEVAEAVAEGFVIAGMASRGEHMVIMEREAP